MTSGAPLRRDRLATRSRRPARRARYIALRNPAIYDRSVTPEPCSKPRYGTLKYNSG